jgi:hypothetical protein
MGKVSELVSRLQDVRETKEPILQFDEAAYKTAETEMWGWYLEWSKICRHVIKDGNLLRALGFKKRQAPRKRLQDAVVLSERALPAHEAVEALAERAA